jgi:long-chain acyl-CoA synthetase
VTEAAMSIDEAYARLTSPGAPFELRQADVLGNEMAIFARRPPHLRHWLDASAQQWPDAECWVFDDGRRLTYAEHARAVAQVAAGLRDRYGIGRGDRVAILGANSLEWILTFWAAASLGAVTVAMNGWWQTDEIVYALQLTSPKVLIADARRLERLGDIPPSWTTDEGVEIGIPVVAIEDEFAAKLWDTTLDAPLPDGVIDEDDPAAILFTSGTTGRPKGAISTHRNLICFVMISFLSGGARGLQFPRPPGVEVPATVNLCSSPLFHVSGLQSAAIAGIASGTKYVWTTGRFDPKAVLELTVSEGVTRLGGITTQMWRLLEHPDFESYDLSKVTSTGGGGSVWSPELQRTLREKLPNAAANFNVGYGLTECGGLCTMANTEMLLAHPDCVGTAIPTAQVAILDDEGRPLSRGEIGNVCIKGPMVMPGYWNNPVATADAFFAGRWLKSGDFGWMDESGLLFLATRKRDMIIRGGENIYPIEIENRLDEHPAVAEAAVVGVDHRTLGQQVKAIVVPRGDATIDIEDVKAFVGQTLAYYKIPEIIEVRAEPLPRTPTGKIMKHVLNGESENTFIEE